MSPNMIVDKLLLDKHIYRYIFILNTLLLVGFYVLVVFSSSQAIVNQAAEDTKRIIKAILTIVVFISTIMSVPALLLNIFVFSRLLLWYLSLWKITIEYTVLKSVTNLFLLVNITLLTIYIGAIGIDGIIESSLFQFLLPSIHILIFTLFWFTTLNVYGISFKKTLYSILPIFILYVAIQIIIHIF